MQEETRESKSALPRFFTLEMFMFTVTALSGLVLLWSIAVPYRNVAIMVCAGVVFTLSIVVVIRLIMDPDSVRARQSDSMLKLASQTLTCMNDGMDYKAAQKICGLLLPSTAAIAVAITDKKQILGYAGFEEAQNLPGSIIRTHATHATLADGKLRILFTPEDIGFPSESSNIKAAIIVPLAVGRNVEGTLKFYYRRAKHISETQKSIAEGFGKLLSTQMAASALEEQTQLATRMELKMLQSQINPHFLFNTINTIASLIRTDPETARKLLREFAVFYRRTLEDSADLIVFAREMEQTKRYFTFEVARFGADRVEMEMRIDPRVEDMLVPPFFVATARGERCTPRHAERGEVDYRGDGRGHGQRRDCARVRQRRGYDRRGALQHSSSRIVARPRHRGEERARSNLRLLRSRYAYGSGKRARQGNLRDPRIEGRGSARVPVGGAEARDRTCVWRCQVTPFRCVSLTVRQYQTLIY